MNIDKALRDPMTGVYSRAALHERLREEVERASRYSLPLSLLVIDLDHFKSVNDAFGHSRGDRVLKEFTRRMIAMTRSTDPLFRYGGDEFVILLPHNTSAQAVQLARRLLESISAVPFPGEPPLSLTFSVGVASYPEDGETSESLFEVADQRQYQAKRAGRARVVSIEDDPAQISGTGEPGRLIERDMAWNHSAVF
ncbi:MAG: GGDEF domain-containing protein [Chloroflexota bacterium]|nr:MAG: GGDEF domain-containing protein [Chloroflexota bacterium]